LKQIQSQIWEKIWDIFVSNALNNLRAVSPVPTKKVGSAARREELAFLQENFLFMAPRDIRRAPSTKSRP